MSLLSLWTRKLGIFKKRYPCKEGLMKDNIHSQVTTATFTIFWSGHQAEFQKTNCARISTSIGY